MTGPVLRALLENGATYNDPSEDALFILFEDIAAGGALWIIVEKVSDASGQTYAQAVRLEDGTFQVERRSGAPETHETIGPLDLRAAHVQLTRWAFTL